MINGFATTVRDVPDWVERRHLARSTAESLKDGQTADAVDMLRSFACDRKWEVRFEVASHLLLLPDDEFDWFAERLVGDSNAYVCRAAKKACDRRRIAARKAAQARKEEARLARQIKRLEKELGRKAVTKIHRIYQRRNDQQLASMVHNLCAIVAHLKSSCSAATTDPSRKDAMWGDLALLENTVSDMETFAQPTPARKRSERLRDVISAAIDLAKENVRKCRLEPTLVLVRVDVSEAIVLPLVRHLMLMACTNVIKNAYEAFVDEHGRLREGSIDIRARCVGNAVSIEIADDGVGMTESELADVSRFRPGQRNTRKPHSTGYGLPIAARNVDAHGGTLAINSEEHRGTTVTILLPLNDNEDIQR